MLCVIMFVRDVSLHSLGFQTVQDATHWRPEYDVH